MAASYPADLVQAFADMARALLAEKDVQATLERMVELAVEIIEGCDHAGVSLVEGRNLSTRAASDQVPYTVDAIQYATGEGPCLDAIRRHMTFRTGDLGGEDRWPSFAPRAAEASGVASMLCFRLFSEKETMGTLNLYSKQPQAFGEEAEAVGSVFAAHAAVALAAALHNEQMQEALRSRDLIGQAKGILMATRGVDEERAFHMLQEASQRMHVKLRRVAENVTWTGTTETPSA